MFDLLNIHLFHDASNLVSIEMVGTIILLFAFVICQFSSNGIIYLNVALSLPFV